ncbi:MAG: formate dehydrogenase subunit alpha [Desulfamplus sp.]|nr:formate dehydrogenase subunit alpha [Desulfamplus sp.]
MNKKNIITIDNKKFAFETGETILEVAERNGIFIPTLCHLKRTTPTGACRVCVVEVKGAKDLVPSCATPASSGMVVKSESLEVIKARKNIIELMLASGNHNCAIRKFEPDEWTSFHLKVLKDDNYNELCPVWGDCRLQDLAYRYQVTTKELPISDSQYPMETVNPFIIRDFSRCILCGRCVQACREIQVNNAIDFGYRGSKAKIVAGADVSLKDSDCVFCGECVQVCPVGALVPKQTFESKTRFEKSKKVRTTCSYCGVGCQMDLTIQENRIVEINGAEDAEPNHGSLCVKGRYGYAFVASPERLTTPLVKKRGKFEKASWEEALNLVADRLSQIKTKYGADSMGVLTSARVTNEDNYIAQKFTRAVIKTNNIDHCARLCHASTVAGLAASFGSGAMTNTFADIETADVILVTGSNTTENHPVFSTFIKRAALNGKTLIVIDPRKIKLAEHAKKWLRPNPGTDIAWINGLLNVIVNENLHDKEFINSRTEGFEQILDTIKKYTPAYAEEITGIPADEIIETARVFAKAQKASICYCMGITQHTCGTDNVKSLANLSMLCGQLGKPGCGVNPLRGQNNVQGACDMGGLPNVFSGYQKVDDPSMVKKHETEWGIIGLSNKAGLAVTEMINKAEHGELKSLYIIGENPLISDPDINHVEKAFKNLEFLVVQDIFLTETAQFADVVFPSFCFAEKDGTFTNTERRVQRVRKAVDAPGFAREDWKITCEIATRMGTTMHYNSAKEIFEEIRKVTPSYAGITWERIENIGLHWPCPTLEHLGTPILHTKQFTRGKGLFHAIAHQPPAEVPDAEYPYILTTGRVLYHYHTGTMTMKSDGLNEMSPECFVEISSNDAAKLDIGDGEMVNVFSRRGKIKAKLYVSPKAVDGTIFIPFHFAQAAANRLTNSKIDPVAKIPELKVCAVTIEGAA